MEKEIQWRAITIEGVVIVVSILLAFGVDAWWDKAQESRRQAQLETALAGEFAQTREAIAFSLETVETRLDQTRRFLEATNEPASVPVDSIQESFDAVFRAFVFESPLPVYRDASASGAFAELGNTGLSGHLTYYGFLYRKLVSS